jgi:hypothetical protein
VLQHLIRPLLKSKRVAAESAIKMGLLSARVFGTCLPYRLENIVSFLYRRAHNENALYCVVLLPHHRRRRVLHTKKQREKIE